MFSSNGIPSTASSLFSAYASVAASAMLVRSMANEIVPSEVRAYVYSAVSRLFTPLSSDLTLTVDEFVGMSRNEVFDAAELYLRTKIPAGVSRLRVTKIPRQKSVAVAAEKGEIIADEHDGVRVTWQLVCSEPKKNSGHSGDKRHFEITADKRLKAKIVDSYLPYVLMKAKAIKRENRVIKLYSQDCPYDETDDGSPGMWGSINLEHPANFDTLAMDPAAKKAVMDDLDMFLRRRDFYKRVGRAWKRGYLLYGPPGTGKSSLIAAMANYLKFDVYDLELTSIFSNSELRRTLLGTSNRSILVIEDIDCSVDFKNRNGAGNNGGECEGPNNTKLTLSGLLNFIDGLWSSCGDERIIVFTTNHKERLDPALLRPGRMDMHINMSYCTDGAFQTLASNYLGAEAYQHELYGEVKRLISDAEVTPAEVAEELMKSDEANVALSALSDLLKRKRVEAVEKKEQKADHDQKEDEEHEEEDESPISKKVKTVVNGTRNIGRRRVVRGRLRRGF